MAVTPSKYQYQKRIDEDNFDAVRVQQTDTGAAYVLRPVVTLGGNDEGESVSSGGTPATGERYLLVHDLESHNELVDLQQDILEELKKISLILEGIAQ